MRLLILGFALATTHACADTLRADALVCEQPENFSTLRAMMMKMYPDLSLKELKSSDTGSYFLKQIEVSKKLYELNVQAAKLAGSEADKRLAMANVQDVVALRAQCTATTDATVVNIIERRPISGLVKINMLLDGSRVDLWTFAAYLAAN